MKIPKNGSKWTSYDGYKFRVVDTINLEGQIWIHYIKESLEEPKEYSCYVESFLQRFWELPE